MPEPRTYLVPVFRLLTSPGRAGVQVIEFSGGDRLSRLSPFLRRPSGGSIDESSLRGKGPIRVDLFDGEQLLDEALFVDFEEDDRSELHLHGAPVLIGQLGRIWQRVRSEPSRDRFAELLLRAETPAQLALAVEQSRYGDDDWRAVCESGSPSEREAMIEALAVAEALLDPFEVALVGRQNAGKSTLFNRLLMLERNLTGPTPGLTRDAIREVVDLSGYPVRLVDTAGLGQVRDEVDELAQQRTRQIGRDHAVVLVVPSDEGFGPLDRELSSSALFTVRSKADLPVAGSWPESVRCVPIDAVEAGRASVVRSVFGEALRRSRSLPEAPVSGVGFALPKTGEAIRACRCILLA